MTKYLQDRIAELNAVTWPTQKQAIHASITVLTIMFIVAGLLAMFDFGLTQIVNDFILKI